VKWEKKGFIITANGQREWMNSHIQNPCAIELSDCVRVYYTTRPKPENGMFRSVIAFVDLDKNNLSNVIRISEQPVLTHGNVGTFDEDGVMPGVILKRSEQEIWLYYMGWRRSVSVPYFWSIGLAVSKDGGNTFTRFGKGPIMTTDYNDPYLLVAPRAVVYDNDMWHMFYASGMGWVESDGKWESKYLIRRAKSKDGICWDRDEKTCIDKIYDDESQGACCIYKTQNYYHAYFSYRHSVDFRNKERGYLIGHAYSSNLESWVRDDKNDNIYLSESGFDSEMMCYPYVMDIENRTVMFYCGNGFGKGGLGYAELACFNPGIV
jgi:hypothetical protein